MKRTGCREAGVTIVEAAFVIPLLFMFIFGLVDLGMWTLNSNQASNAARDGARAGILAFPLRGADLAAAETDARETIVEAVQKRLPKGTVEDTQITITCQGPTGATVPCTDTAPDRVKVDVAWGWTLATPLATILNVDEGDVRGSAKMEIVGRPLEVVAPPSPEEPDDPLDPSDPSETACAISNLSAPGSMKAKGSQLTAPIPVTFTYVSGDCNDLRMQLTGTKTNAETILEYCGCGDAPNYSWTYAGSNNIWQASTTKKGRVTVLNGPTALAFVEFSVT